MSEEIKKLKPENVWALFYELTQIPRPSKHEGRAIEFVKNFGEKHGLKTIVDQTGNVILKKPATPGMENKKTVVLQGHLDMVPQKNSGVEHNFETDPIDAYIDGEWVTARDTTLGADNGIGLAAALAVMESKDLAHGPLEALFTVDEETGMTGAFGLKAGVLDADILINLDSEDEGELYVGCAGGEDTVAEFTYKEENVPAGSSAYKFSVTGMKGGHSGLDINLGRGNAIKTLSRFLVCTMEKFNIRLSSIDGGSLRNAIPREAFAVLAVEKSKENELKAAAQKYNEMVKKELAGTEPGLKISFEPADMPAAVMDADTAVSCCKALYSCPNGVIRMSDAVEGLVETSSNLAVVKTENGKISMASLQRSSVDSARKDICAQMKALFEIAGAKAENQGAYPGWAPNMNSPILKTMQNVYNDLYGKVPEVKAIHAGLECGIIGANYPDMDMISFGPTMKFPHSPDEKLNIATVQKFWDFLAATLKAVPEK